MPKKIEYKTQVYDIGNDATVTVRFRSDKRPKMVHNDTQVVVGEGVNLPVAQMVDGHRVGAFGAAQPPPIERASAWTPELDAKFKAAQEEGRRRRESAAEIAANGAGAEGALTAEDMKQFTDGLEFAALAAVGT